MVKISSGNMRFYNKSLEYNKEVLKIDKMDMENMYYGYSGSENQITFIYNRIAETKKNIVDIEEYIESVG